MSGRQLSRAGLTNEETANSSPSLLSIEVSRGRLWLLCRLVDCAPTANGALSPCVTHR
jgi:hypothetical protein